MPVPYGTWHTSTHKNAKTTKQLSKIYGPIKTWRGQKTLKKNKKSWHKKLVHINYHIPFSSQRQSCSGKYYVCYVKCYHDLMRLVL